MKLKCSRELPICRRCDRLRSACYYVYGPHTKNMSTRRLVDEWKSKSSSQPLPDSQAFAANVGTTAVPSHMLADGTFQKGSTLVGLPLHCSLPNTPLSIQHDLRPMFQPLKPVGLSRELALFLIDIYFERHYQSYLLFNKEDIVARCLENRLPDFIALSTFAFASL